MSKVFRVINFFNKFIFFFSFSILYFVKSYFYFHSPHPYFTPNYPTSRKKMASEKCSLFTLVTFQQGPQPTIAGKWNVKRERELIWDPHTY